MKKVLVLGGVSFNTMIYLDAFPQPRPQTVFSRSFHETVGSSGAGKALNLHKLGLDVTLHGVLGDDGYGDQIKAYFEREGLPFVYDVDPQGTKRHVNLMDGQGRRISIFIAYGSSEPGVSKSWGTSRPRRSTPCSSGARDVGRSSFRSRKRPCGDLRGLDWRYSPKFCMRPSEPEIALERIEALLSDSDYLALGLLSYCKRLIPLAQKHGKAIWCDIHDYDGQNTYHQDFIRASDYLFMSSNSLPDYRSFMQRLIEQGKKLVVCTHGRDGSTALAPDGRWIETPIISAYPRQDTNGAGDSFFAGFMYGHSQGYPVEKCLQMGTLVAGLCVTSLELAFPDLSPAMVEAEYRKHYPKE